MSRRSRSRREYKTFAREADLELDRLLLSTAHLRQSRPLETHYTRYSVQLLTEIEDLREYHPLGQDQPIVAFTGGPAVVREAPRAARRRDQATIETQLPHRIGVEAPTRVVTCVRRAQRREVLHALRKTGRGSWRRKPRRTWRSDIHCK